ncbi:uncharacterized protein RHO25_006691 [Cercospora beticola]|uniref:Hydrophobin n=1 Tax=Cercospora beticola TaxID=122368 RepID=A0ABZ0NRH0_CERBT|nr:hypothetical protein RHO25_006691 [Cercospora beticola]
MHFSAALIAALASGALAAPAPQGNVAGGLLKTATGAASGKGGPLGALGGLGGVARRQYGYGNDKKPATYGEAKPVYHEDKPVYHEDKPVYHEDKPVYHEDKPVYHEDKPVYHEDKPVYKPTPVYESKPVYEPKETYPAKEAYPVYKPEDKPYPVQDKPAYPTLTHYYDPAKPTYDAAAAYPKGRAEPLYPEEDLPEVPLPDEVEPPVDDEADEVPDVVDPTDDDEVIVDEPANNGTAIASQCGVGNAVSCCNTASEGSALSLVLGGSCSLQIPVLAAALGNGCNAGNSFCCPTTQNGDINVGLPCIPINI